jgi:hypothetical protein
MTVIECISPSGLVVLPSFILLNGPTPVLTETKVSTPIGAIRTSQNSWMDNQIRAMWFKDKFNPFAEFRNVSNDLIVLFLNGHGLHESEEFRNPTFEHGVIVITFPFKCIYNLQPLNIVIYTQTQHQWTKHCDHQLYNGVQMDRYNIIQEYMSMRPKSMMPELLHSAFKATGIHPFNSNIFTDTILPPPKHPPV